MSRGQRKIKRAVENRGECQHQTLLTHIIVPRGVSVDTSILILGKSWQPGSATGT